jgi:hypothetical protein
MHTPYKPYLLEHWSACMVKQIALDPDIKKYVFYKVKQNSLKKASSKNLCMLLKIFEIAKV